MTIRHRQKHKIWFLHLDEVDFELPSEELVDAKLLQSEREQHLYEGMANLKTEYREALYLVSLEGMSYREAARILGKSEQQITNQQLIHRRTLEIQREQQKKRERVISGSGIAACLMIIIGIGCLMPEVTKQASVSGAKTNYTTGMASMLGNYEALGYICMGILAFALGVCVTILLYRLRKAEEHRKKAEEYKQSQQVRENRLKKE